MPKYLTVFAVAVLLFAGCGGKPTQPQAKAPVQDEPEPAAAEVSFSRDVQPIFSASCMPCHAPGGGAAKYDLTSYDKVATLVEPGKSGSSKLFTVLDQGKMPPSGKLDSAKLTAVQKWIDEGAKNN